MRAIRSAADEIIGDYFWSCDQTRRDEIERLFWRVVVAGYVAYKLDMWTIILLLTAAQLMFTWFDVGKALEGFRALCGKGGDASR